MGRKLIHKNSTEKVRSWRNKNRGCITISKLKYDKIMEEAKATWERMGYSSERVLGSYPLYKEYWLKEHNIDVTKYDPDFIEDAKKTRISVDLQLNHPEQIKDLGFDMSFINVEEALNLHRYFNLECPFCEIEFSPLEDHCPKCKRQVKIVEEQENKTRAEMVYEQRRWDF